jgi:hypothetical protein
MQFSALFRCKAVCNINDNGEFMMADSSVADQTSSVERSDSERLLVMAAENLKKSIEHSVGQLGMKRVRGEMKLRWSRSLTRQVEALVKVAEALNKIGGGSAVDIDLASYLSGLETRVPRKFATKKLCRIAKKYRRSGLMYGRYRV